MLTVINLSLRLMLFPNEGFNFNEVSLNSINLLLHIFLSKINIVKEVIDFQDLKP